MPGRKYASIKSPRKYHALRRQGMSKTRAAAITNGTTPGRTVKQAPGAASCSAPNASA
jgi:hypothetical protein